MDPNAKSDTASLGTSSRVIKHRAYARVGLLGNPSDVYNGRTISFSLGNFWASVQLQPSDELDIQPHPIHDLVHFRSLHHLVLSLSLCFRLHICTLFASDLHFLTNFFRSGVSVVLNYVYFVRF